MVIKECFRSNVVDITLRPHGDISYTVYTDITYTQMDIAQV